MECFLPEEITFISSQELENWYPDCTPKERENKAARKFGAVFISQIGGALISGEPERTVVRRTMTTGA